LFQSTEELSTREVAGRFLNLLRAVVSMKAVMPNVVYYKNKQLMRNFSQDNASNFEKSLPVDKLRANQKHRKPYSYWTIFQLKTHLTVSEIRRHDHVANVITGTNGRLSIHPWNPSV
jgi:hypothetical protein